MAGVPMSDGRSEGPLEVVQRVCAIDIAKTDLVACVRVPHDSDQGKRVQEIREFTTLSASLLRLADWLRVQQVELVAMEATSTYWKPVFYLLEAEGFTCWLLNAKHVKNVPGRPKTDRLDAVWLAKVVERGMCRPSLVQPVEIRQLRDLTRYRRTLIRERSREKQRLEKFLEDAQIKLSSVIEDLCGVSGRQMLEALIAGERNPSVLARMARGRMRAKIPMLEEALRGHFTDHHAFLCRMMLDRIDELDARITQVSSRVDECIAPFTDQAARLDEVTGIGVTSAQELIAEIGVTMTVFPTARHLVVGLKNTNHRQRWPSPCGIGYSSGR
jgi:transposase